MRERICVLCKHWDVYLAEPDWSDVTPGSDFEMGCTKGHWTMDPYNDGTETLRRYMLLAGSCPDFDQVELD